MVGVIFLAHGSPRSDWRVPLDHLVASLGLEEGDGGIAFMEHCPPSLAEVVQGLVSDGKNRLLVFPLFLSSRGHVSREVAAQVEEERARHPGISFEVMPALGELKPVIDGLRSVVQAALDET